MSHPQIVSEVVQSNMQPFGCLSIGQQMDGRRSLVGQQKRPISAADHGGLETSMSYELILEP